MSDELDFKTRFANGSEVLQSLFEDGKSPLSEQFIRWKMWAQWKDFVGPFVAEQTEPVGLYKGTLWVWVRHSTWMQQMLFVKREIIDNVNTKLKRNFINEVKFTLDRREVPIAAGSTGLKFDIEKLAKK
ncbi:MAG: DUF721 domain-containing protein [Bdellovibrionota bacterium]